MFGYSKEEGIELAHMVNGNLARYLRGENGHWAVSDKEREVKVAAIREEMRVQWACDAAEALQVLHEHGVFHCDVQATNFVLDEELRLRVIDFEGSSLDGSRATSVELVNYYLPRPFDDPPTATTEVFALGSFIYEIMTGNPPYKELDDDEITELFVKKQFPPVDHLPCGDIMMKCWHSQLHSAKEVHALLALKLQDRKQRH